MKDLADIALNTAKQKGASYADIRIVRTLNNFVTTREKRVENVTNTESYGFGVRVLVNGVWGFAASSKMDKEEVARVTERAVSIAKANQPIQRNRISLVPVEKYPDVKFNTPFQINPFTVTLSTKAELLRKVYAVALE